MINPQYIAEALAALRPGIGFSCQNDDLSTLQCISGSGSIPTPTEITNKIAELHPA